MSKLRFAAAFLLAVLCAAPAVQAQTQAGVVPGFMAAAGINGCPTNNACFVPYSNSNPLPVTSSGGSGSSTITAPLGTQPAANAVAVTPSQSIPVATSALAANQVIITGAHQLTAFQVTADSTLSAAAWWVMVYDATSAPADGAVTPTKCFGYPPGTTTASYGWTTPPKFTTGIVIGVSTNGCFTKAASTHAFISGDYQ